jgi:hypothetical protein
MADIFGVEISKQQVTNNLFLFTAERSLNLNLFYFNIVFSNIIYLCSTLKTIDKFACPCRKTGTTVNILLLCISDWKTYFETNPEM